jgi:Protein of unknown function (DUF5674)
MNNQEEMYPGIRIVSERVTPEELKKLAAELFGDMVKGVVDVQKKIMALGGEMYADEEALLLENGSLQENLWGINLYPDESAERFIEFDSMINIRPRQGNRSRDVLDQTIREKIIEIVKKLVF